MSRVAHTAAPHSKARTSLLSRLHETGRAATPPPGTLPNAPALPTAASPASLAVMQAREVSAQADADGPHRQPSANRRSAQPNHRPSESTPSLQPMCLKQAGARYNPQVGRPHRRSAAQFNHVLSTMAAPRSIKRYTLCAQVEPTLMTNAACQEELTAVRLPTHFTTPNCSRCSSPLGRTTILSFGRAMQRMSLRYRLHPY